MVVGYVALTQTHDMKTGMTLETNTLKFQHEKFKMVEGTTRWVHVKEIDLHIFIIC